MQDNILPQDQPQEDIKPKKSWRSRIIKTSIYLLAFLFVGFAIFTSHVIITAQKNTASWLNRVPLLSTIQNLAESADQKLKGEDRKRINVLLLGMGGKNHDGGLLTDTIILVSLDLENKKVAMVSIPRDMTIPMENYGWRKINAVNAYAEKNKPDSGGVAVSQAIGDLLNIPIDYYVRVDFDGFEHIIDKVGGVKVYVDNAFDDYSYPIRGREDAQPYSSRYEHLHFDKGWQNMDGSLALKYARSRHAYGVEGSDFSRAKRQQKIIEAVKEKLLSAETIFNPAKIMGIMEELNSNISTNVKIWEAVKLWSDFKNITSDSIINKVLDNSAGGLLVNKVGEDGAYILVPRSGDFSEIQYMVQNIFNDAPAEDKTELKQETATIEIRNGTWINGLASRVSLDLEKYGYDIVRVANSSRQNIQNTTIYDLTYGEKNKSLDILKKKLKATSSVGMPDWLLQDLTDSNKQEAKPIQPDFIIVLGQNADAAANGTANSEQ